jgi:THUMP domain-like
MNLLSPSTELNELQRWFLEHARGFLTDATARQRSHLSQVQQALLEQQQAWRHRSRFRFPQPELWMWSDRSLAQSSDWLSAAFKASLFPAGELVVDGCCGAGVDAVALSFRGPTIGVDCDPWLAAIAHSNAASHGQQIETYAEMLTVDSLRGAKWIHVDPDRRSDQAKTLRADEFSPPLGSLSELFEHVEGGIVKVAPSTELNEEDAEWVDQHCCRAWIGSFGECRQQLLLVNKITEQQQFRELVQNSESTNQRIAIVLSAPAGPHATAMNWFSSFQFAAFAADDGSIDDGPEPTLEIGKYMFDLNATLHAAELQQAWAEDNEVEAVTDVRGYFTGDHPIDDPLTQSFEVLEVLPWDDRKIRKWLRGQKFGNVEVKCRLAKLDASSFQRRYSSEQGEPLTLLVTKVGDRVRAAACRRL